MRLAIVTHNVVRGDGQGRVNYEIARHALRHGYEVSVLADRVADDLLAAGARWVPVHPYPWRLNLVKFAEFALRANRTLARMPGAFDVVQGSGFVLSRPHHVNISQFVHGAWRRSPVHTSHLRHDLYGAYHWLYEYMNARWERGAYRQAKVVVAPSGQIKEELAGIGVPGDRVRVIWNGVDLQEFRPGPADRTALGLPEDVVLALFVGDIRTPRKNLDTVLKALVHVPDLHLAVVGALPRSPYPQLATELGLTERVHFLDFRRDVPEIMRAVDMFVFPSRYEACSLVLLEATASGLPVITGRLTGGAETITSEAAVLLPDPNDAEVLASVLRDLTADPERRAHMGRVARQVAEERGWDRMADTYLKLFQEVAA